MRSSLLPHADPERFFDFDQSDSIGSWEQYAQDDSTVTIDHVGREDYRIRCSCGEFAATAGGETQANERAMAHVLEHDIACEEAEADAE